MRQAALLAVAGLTLVACGEAKNDAPTPSETPVIADASAEPAAATEAAVPAFDVSATPAGLYKSDPNHAYILFTYDHAGYSHPQIRWRSWSADLDWNPSEPEQSAVTVVIDASKPDSGVDVFDGHLRDEGFFDAAKYPEIKFASTSIERTGEATAKVTGDLTIKDVTKPLTLDVTINRAANDDIFKAYKLGFSARGTVKRSDYGLDKYVPLVSDEVDLVIETEFAMPREEDAPAAQ